MHRLTVPADGITTVRIDRHPVTCRSRPTVISMAYLARKSRALTSNRAFARWMTGLLLTSSILAPGAALASTARELDRGVIARIRGARTNQKIVLPNVVLSDTEMRTIEIEEFSVYAPDVAILVYDSDPPRRIAPPARRYFKGRVADDPPATVFFSVSTNSSEVDGLIVIGERKFVIASGRRLARQRRARAERDAPILMAEIDPLAGGVESPPFQCATENLTMPRRLCALRGATGRLTTCPGRTT